MPGAAGSDRVPRRGRALRIRQVLAGPRRDRGPVEASAAHVRIISPAPRPVEALAAGTAGRSEGTVLVVDQCEEIFAPTVPESVRATFLVGVAEHARHGAVVLTLRADRVGELSAHPDLARLVEDSFYLLKGITPDGLRQLIEEPARQSGLLLEQGLVDLLVRDVEHEPGSLPLLAHALSQTWERRQGTTLTVEGYRASGGIAEPSRARRSRSTRRPPRSSDTCCASCCCGWSSPAPPGSRSAPAFPGRPSAPGLARHGQAGERALPGRPARRRPGSGRPPERTASAPSRTPSCPRARGHSGPISPGPRRSPVAKVVSTADFVCSWPQQPSSPSSLPVSARWPGGPAPS